MSMKTKTGYGKKTGLNAAIEAGTIDSGDIVFTSDTESRATSLCMLKAVLRKQLK